MKKTGLVLLFLLITVFAFSQEFNLRLDEPVKELLIGVSEVTPPWSLGVEAEYLVFPMGIPTDDGLYNLLGFGAQAGFFMEFEGSLNPFRICVLFDGRFQFSETVSMDMDTGLGAIITSEGAAFLGTMGFGVNFQVNEKLRLRPYAGLDFAGNPNYDPLDYYDEQFIKWLHAGVSAVFTIGKDI